MKFAYWEKVNKWLYIGPGEGMDKPFTIMFDNWFWFSRVPTIRQWSLFEIMWDNGAWWGNLPDKEEVSIPRMNGEYIENDEFTKMLGELPCFVQVTIFGIGFRLWYKKDMTVVIGHPQQKEEAPK